MDPANSATLGLAEEIVLHQLPEQIRVERSEYIFFKQISMYSNFIVYQCGDAKCWQNLKKNDCHTNIGETQLYRNEQ
jgi:hypothetical protein